MSRKKKIRVKYKFARHRLMRHASNALWSAQAYIRAVQKHCNEEEVERKEMFEKVLEILDNLVRDNDLSKLEYRMQDEYYRAKKGEFDHYADDSTPIVA